MRENGEFDFEIYRDSTAARNVDGSRMSDDVAPDGVPYLDQRGFQDGVIHKIERDNEGYLHGVTGLSTPNKDTGSVRGYSPRHDDLNNLHRDQLIAFYERRDRGKISQVDLFLSKLSWIAINGILREKYGEDCSGVAYN